MLVILVEKISLLNDRYESIRADRRLSYRESQKKRMSNTFKEFCELRRSQRLLETLSISKIMPTSSLVGGWKKVYK
jgi:hypothetical protein